MKKKKKKKKKIIQTYLILVHQFLFLNEHFKDNLESYWQRKETI